jgi:hypothetical protein
VRLAYVAVTRARDLLVVPACGDQPLPGWLEVLNPALYPPDDAKRQSEPVPGAPSFGAESVIDRGPQGVSPDGDCVRPGLHRPSVGTHTVAWWDPNVLALEAEEHFGVRQQRILEADETGTEVARGEESYNQWREGRSAAIGQASHPTIKVQTATAFAAAASLSESDLRRIQIEIRAPTLSVQAADGSARWFMRCSPQSVLTRAPTKSPRWPRPMQGS